MKRALPFWLGAVVAVITSSALGQSSGSSTGHIGGLAQPDTYSTSTTGLGTTSKTATGAAPSETPNRENNTDERDDTLYRGKTTESDNPMMRDEGPLHFKTRPKEKTIEVDSLKNLQSTGSDPKFQGGLVTSGVSSIDKVAVKANEPAEAAAGATEEDKYQGDPRFAKKRLKFTPQQEDGSAKAKANADSSPSPAPSPSASPAKKKATDTKQ